MKFRNFLGVSNTTQQAYFKEGIEMLYPSLDTVLKLAILPAYNQKKPDPTGWVPAVVEGCESDFYTTIRAAKFVGHGNRRAKTAFLSPRTFDKDADDPYEAFYDYCSRTDKWSYLTKDRRGKRLTGEVEGAIFPKMKNYFAANVMDVSAGSRGGVFVSELSESVAKGILYSLKKNGTQVDGIAFQRGQDGKLLFGDITCPDSALVIEIAFTGKAYVARPSMNHDGSIARVEIPDTLLQHRQHMESPESFLVHPGSGQEIVDRLVDMLRGYKSDSGTDEIKALKEAMDFAYGGKYQVSEKDESGPVVKLDPLCNAAREVVDADPEKKVEAVDNAVKRGVENEKYTPVNPAPEKTSAKKYPKVSKERPVDIPEPDAPGEDIDPSDIAAMRAMLSGGK